MYCIFIFIFFLNKIIRENKIMKGDLAKFSIPPPKDLKWNSPKDVCTGQSVYIVS